MPQRTYVPGLRFFFRKAYKYASRWLPNLTPNLTDEQLDSVVHCIEGLAACLELLGENPTAP
jgi:hypothetical protein